MWKTNLIFSVLIVGVMGAFIHGQRPKSQFKAKAEPKITEVPVVSLSVEKPIPAPVPVSVPLLSPEPEPVKPHDVLQLALDYQKDVHQAYEPDVDYDEQIADNEPFQPSIEILDLSNDPMKKAQFSPGPL